MFENGMFNSMVSKQIRPCLQHSKVRVYRNLNKPEFFSILAMTGEYKGKVVGYARSILLVDFVFKVSEASRLRTNRLSQRNVHAFCDGFVQDAFEYPQDLHGGEIEVSYNPFKAATFYEVNSLKPVVTGMHTGLIQNTGVYLYPDTKKTP